MTNSSFYSVLNTITRLLTCRGRGPFVLSNTTSTDTQLTRVVYSQDTTKKGHDAPEVEDS